MIARHTRSLLDEPALDAGRHTDRDETAH
jgi:hypothetical protein